MVASFVDSRPYSSNSSKNHSLMINMSFKNHSNLESFPFIQLASLLGGGGILRPASVCLDFTSAWQSEEVLIKMTGNSKLAEGGSVDGCLS